MPHSFSRRLLSWYAAHRRRLPWRSRRDPYRIWVAEVMLQQTQVETVIPYYRRWLKRFPDVRALAAASQQEVLALWEGLGYYARARNLHQAARQVVEAHGGEIPRTLDGLRALPGIGRYTAGAIASIAFGLDAAVLDGNVKRVLARAYDFRGDARSPRGEKELWALAESLVPAGRAGDYNQALMDLGATVCTPRAPACGVCPLRATCAARKLGVQLERPIRSVRRAPLPHHTFAAGVIWKNGRVLIVRRPAGALLGGLWAFPRSEAKRSGAGRGRTASVRSRARAGLPELLHRAVRDELGLTIRVGPQIQTLTHTFTHFRMTLHVFDCRSSLERGRKGRRRGATKTEDGPVWKWVRVGELGDSPMGKADRQIAAQLEAPTLPFKPRRRRVGGQPGSGYGRSKARPR